MCGKGIGLHFRCPPQFARPFFKAFIFPEEQEQRVCLTLVRLSSMNWKSFNRTAPDGGQLAVANLRMRADAPQPQRARGRFPRNDL